MTDQTDTPTAGDRVRVAFDATYYGTSVGQPNAAVVIGVDTPIDNARLRDRYVVPVSAVTPAGETTDDAVTDVAAAIERAFASGSVGWLVEARAAIAAYLPHQAAERDAETEQLRSYLASSAQTVDDLRGVITTKTEEIDRLRAENEQLRADLAGALEIQASEMDRRASYMSSTRDRQGIADLREAAAGFRARAAALRSPAPEPAVLADPAPSTPEHLDVDQLPADRVETLAQWLHGRNIGICEMDDDTVYNGIESMRELAQALLQHGPDGIRVTASSTQEGQT